MGFRKNVFDVANSTNLFPLYNRAFYDTSNLKKITP